MQNHRRAVSLSPRPRSSLAVQTHGFRCCCAVVPGDSRPRTAGAAGGGRQPWTRLERFSTVRATDLGNPEFAPRFSPLRHCPVQTCSFTPPRKRSPLTPRTAAPGCQPPLASVRTPRRPPPQVQDSPRNQQRACLHLHFDLAPPRPY